MCVGPGERWVPEFLWCCQHPSLVLVEEEEKGGGEILKLYKEAMVAGRKTF